MAKLTLVYSWRTTTSCAERAEKITNIFIIQFLPMYLADFARAWLDHLPRDIVDSLDDLQVLFTRTSGVRTCIQATTGI
jgi:hypothetical protein